MIVECSCHKHTDQAFFLNCFDHSWLKSPRKELLSVKINDRIHNVWDNLNLEIQFFETITWITISTDNVEYKIKFKSSTFWCTWTNYTLKFDGQISSLILFKQTVKLLYHSIKLSTRYKKILTRIWNMDQNFSKKYCSINWSVVKLPAWYL